jgi:uncharacterized protein YbbK (DUF523 family)
MNRSPSCGVNTTSKDNREIAGEGVFVDALRRELEKCDIQVDFVGIKTFEMEKAIPAVKDLLGIS